MLLTRLVQGASRGFAPNQTLERVGLFVGRRYLVSPTNYSRSLPVKHAA